MTAQYEFRKLIAQVCIMGGVLVAICIFSRMLSGDHYMARVPLGDPNLGMGDIRYTLESDNKAELTDAEIHDGVLYLDLHAEEAGHCSVEVVDEKGRVIKCNEYTVGRGMTVFEEETGNFTGDSFVAGALSVFFLATAALMLRFYRRSAGVRLYSYNTIFSVGMFAFAGMTGMMFLVLFLQHIADPNQFPMRNVYVVVSKAGISFVRFTSPLVILFSVLLIISNIELLRHERYRFQNILGQQYRAASPRTLQVSEYPRSASRAPDDRRRDRPAAAIWEDFAGRAESPDPGDCGQCVRNHFYLF